LIHNKKNQFTFNVVMSFQFEVDNNAISLPTAIATMWPLELHFICCTPFMLMLCMTTILHQIWIPYSMSVVWLFLKIDHEISWYAKKFVNFVVISLEDNATITFKIHQSLYLGSSIIWNESWPHLVKSLWNQLSHNTKSNHSTQ
jgi:hypothetical protein